MFGEMLQAERKRLENELADVGVKNPQKRDDWSPIVDEGRDVSTADKNELADKFEDLEENSAIVSTLESQLQEVDDALARIDAGTYGHDTETGEPIPVDRLEANPAARRNI